MKQINKKITIAGTTYQNDDLVLAKCIKFIIVRKQWYTLKNGDFTFDLLTGTVNFLTITLFVNDTIQIMYK